VYIFIPKVDIGFGGGIDLIPADFNFDESSCYAYQETSIKGVILIGAYTDIIDEGSQPNEKKLIVRTKVFPSCSSSVANFLKQIDCSVLDRSEFLDSTSKILDK
jgi:hypothetical protein